MLQCEWTNIDFMDCDLWSSARVYRDLKHEDALDTTWPPVLSIDKRCHVTSSSIERTDHHVLLKASSCLRCLILGPLRFIIYMNDEANITMYADDTSLHKAFRTSH